MIDILGHFGKKGNIVLVALHDQSSGLFWMFGVQKRTK